MKKYLLIALSLVVISGLLLGLAGCGEPEETTTATSAPPTTTTGAPPTTTTGAPPTTTTTAPPTSATTAPPTDARLPNLGDLAKPEGGTEGGRLQLSTMANIADIGYPAGSAGPADAAITWLAVEPLLRIDKNNALQPWLAESFEIAPDNSSITLYLRQGISYTDGTPFDAAAAEYNITREINSLMWPNLKGFSQCVIVDDYTIRCDFVNGQWDWIAVKSLAGWWSALMFCPTTIENNPPEYCMTNVVGTGPFVQTGYEPNLSINFDRNENYWRGKPYLDGIDISVITDTNVALMAFKSGEIHTVAVQPQDAQGVIDEGFEIRESTDMVFNWCLLPSSGNPDSLLSDINLRRAVESAIDKQTLVDAFTYGYGVPTNQEFCLEPFINPDTVGYPFDLDAARDYLAAGGQPNGFTTTIYIVQGSNADVPMAIQGMLTEVNITLNIETIGYLQLVEMIGGGGTGWDGYIYSYGFPGTTVDPASTLKNGPLNAVPDAENPGEWIVTTWISCEQPKELCDLALLGAQTIDNDARIPIYQEISKKMTDDYCQWTYLYYTPSLTSISPLVKGHTVGMYTEFYAYTFAWLEE
jgi:ABC-type transport system substrate-binding protein